MFPHPLVSLILVYGHALAAERCQKGWKNFTRPSGPWCMKVFYENWLTQPEAEAKCQAEEATLSGFQNMLESLYVTSTVTQHLYPNTGSVWVGIKRKDVCLGQKVNDNCTMFSSFEWTDRSATGTDGIVWNFGQPANYLLTQNCAILATGYTGYIDNFQVGMLDDVECDMQLKGNPRDVRAFVCGKPPGC